MKTQINVGWDDVVLGPDCIQYYQGKPVVEGDELPDGSIEMYYCDKNNNPLPDSPKIICGPPPFME